MKALTPQEYQLAYALWLKSYGHSDADEKIKPHLNTDTNSKSFSWLEKARTALLLSGENLANKLGITRSAYANLEKNERLGSISIKSLMKCAEAMNCELVYAIRPKEAKTFSKVIWEKILKGAAKQIEIRSTPEHMKGFALAAIAREKMQDPKFRRSQNWAQS